MADNNRGVVYTGPGSVQVQDMDYPKLELLRPGALAHAVAAHRSAEPGHLALLERLGKPPVLDLGLRLGEGSGALAAVPLLRLAAAVVTEVATFAEWGLEPR